MSIAGTAQRASSWPDPIRRYHSFVTLVVAGLIAIGISGLACDALGRLYGKDIIAGDSQSAQLSASRCADLLSWYPRSVDCAHAELAHHTYEVVTYREVMLPAGLMLAAAYWLTRRRWLARDAEDAGVRRLRLRIGAGAFALAALLLFGNAVAEHSTAGLGRNLSDAVVASIAALAFGWPAWHERSTGA